MMQLRFHVGGEREQLPLVPVTHPAIPKGDFHVEFGDRQRRCLLKPRATPWEQSAFTTFQAPTGGGIEVRLFNCAPLGLEVDVRRVSQGVALGFTMELQTIL